MNVENMLFKKLLFVLTLFGLILTKKASECGPGCEKDDNGNCIDHKHD